MTTFSAGSIYGIIDRMDADSIRRWLDFHRRLKYPPRFINVFTAARFNDAPDILRGIKNALPETTPVWRGYDGKDAWGNFADPEWTDEDYYINLWNRNATTPVMAAGMWFARRVKPYLDLIRETNAIVHLLNEAGAVTNAPFETECIRLLGEEGLRAGAFAWNAGTPDLPEYQHKAIADEVAMAVKYKSLVMCHEYAGVLKAEQNSLINRYTKLTDLFPKHNQSDVFIGEFGLAKATLNPVKNKVDLDPGIGWREMNVLDWQYMDFIRNMNNDWYKPNKVSWGLYSWPDWGRNGSFGVGNSDRLLDLLVANSEQMCFTVDEDKPTPAPLPIEIVTPPVVEPPPPIEVVTTPPVEPPPAPVPEPKSEPEPPPAAPAIVKMRYSLEIEALAVDHTEIEKGIMGILAGIIYLGKAMSNAYKITLVTEDVPETEKVAQGV